MSKKSWRKAFAALVVLTMLFGIAGLTSAATLTDIAGHWAEADIKALVDKGIIAGLPGNVFDPEGSLTREQFAKIIVLAAGKSVESPAVPTFTDVPADRWSFGYVEAAAKAGYIKGVGANKFDPAANITREQIAAIFIRALGLDSVAASKASGTIPFSDAASISDWAKGYAVLAAELSLVKGIDGKFEPKANATRAQAATMASRFLAADKEAPTASLDSKKDLNTLYVVFSEAVDKASAETTGNYSLAVTTDSSKTVEVTAAALQSDEKTVKLTTKDQTKDLGYTLKVSGVQDKSYNTMTAASFNYVAKDNIKPTLLSATAVASNKVKLTFSEKVYSGSLLTANVVEKGTATTVATGTINVSLADATDKITVTLGTSLTIDKEYTLTVSGLKDKNDNATDPAAVSADFKVVADTVAPTVSSVASKSLMIIEVVFSEEVDKASAETTMNYDITTSGYTGSLTGAALQSDNKTIRLTYNADFTESSSYDLKIQNITDLWGNRMDTVTKTFTAVKDTGKPTVTSISVVDATTLKVVFSKEMNVTDSGSDGYVDAGVATIAEANAAKSPGTIQAKDDADDKSNTIMKLVFTSGSMTGGTAYNVVLKDYLDVAGNKLAEVTLSVTYSGAADVIPPEVASVAVPSGKDNQVKVTFSEKVDQSTATTVANYSIVKADDATSTLEVQSVAMDGESAVILTTARQTAGTANYRITVKGVKDKAGNTVVPYAGKFDGKDVTGPSYSSLEVLNSTQVEVTFNENLGTQTLSVSVVKTGQATAISGVTVVDGTSGDKKLRIVFPSSTPMENGVSYTATLSNVMDANSNTTSSVTVTFTGYVDGSAPTVVSVTPIHLTTLDVAFNEPLDSSNLGTFTVNSVVASVYSLLSDNKTVRIENLRGLEDGKSYTVKVEGTKNREGIPVNTIQLSFTAAKDTTKPTISSVTALSDSKLKVVFSEAVDQTSAGKGANYATVKSGTATVAAATGAAVDTEDKSGKTVLVTFATNTIKSTANYLLTVNNVKDKYGGNAIAADSTVTFAGLDWTAPSVTIANIEFSGGIVYGKADAVSPGAQVIIKKDVNGDGTVDSEDATIAVVTAKDDGSFDRVSVPSGITKLLIAAVDSSGNTSAFASK